MPQNLSADRADIDHALAIIETRKHATTNLAAGAAATPRANLYGLGRSHWGVVGLLTILAAVWQLSHPPSADVSWLIVIGEKMLAGQHLYTDIVEVNPPMSALLYLPAVLIEHATGLAAEVVQVGLTLGLILVSLFFVARIMRESGRGDAIGRVLIVAAILLTIAPMLVFSEREHIAVTILLPGLALMVARAEGFQPDLPSRFLVGVAMGLAVCIKPHFALAILLPGLYLAISLRTWRIVFGPECVIAGVIMSIYAATVLLVFPAYLSDMVPILADTYRVVREPPLHLAATNLGFIIVAGTGVLVIALLGRTARKPRIVIPMLAATGFLLTFLEQGKGWLYHLYPALVIVYLVLVAEALPKLSASLRVNARSLVAVLAVAASLKGLVMIVSVYERRDAFETALQPYVSQHFVHPRMLSLGRSLGIGQPLTRMVGGTWVGSNATAFIPEAAAYVRDLPASAELKARIDHWVDWDRARLARDLRDGQPDLVLLDRNTYPYDALMASGTDAARLLSRYHVVTTIDGIDLLVPTAHEPPTVASDPRAG